MQITVANTTSKRPFSTPGPIGGDGDLPAVVCLRVVYVQLEWPTLVGLNQAEQVLALVQDTVSPDDVVGELPEPCQLSRAAWRHF